MLMLTRNRGESIYIDDEKIVIHIVEIRGDKVRIGIDAPREITVLRPEAKLKTRRTKDV